jgi:hypothetical protein
MTISKKKTRGRFNLGEFLRDSAFAGGLLSLSLAVAFFTHLIDIMQSVFASPSTLITVGAGTTIPYVDSADSFMNSKPLTGTLFFIALCVFVIELLNLIHKYFNKSSVDKD